MARRMARWTILMMLALVGCSQEHPGAMIEDSQTHWLHNCETQSNCGTGMDCVCGRCVVTCQEQVCNVADRQTQCVEPNASAQQSLCGAQASRVPICLENCGADKSCADGQQCVEGVCVPKPRAGCEMDGIHYEPGAPLPPLDCNACYCHEDGSIRCTTIACPAPAPAGCDDNGKHYEIGDVIPRDTPACPGSCVCTADGIGHCTGACRETSCSEEVPCADGQHCVEGLCVPNPSTGCDIAGVHYEPGAAVPTGDCAACTCNADGSFDCTTSTCPVPASTGCDDNGKHYEVGETIPRGTPACPVSCVCIADGVSRCTGACREPDADI